MFAVRHNWSPKTDAFGSAWLQRYVARSAIAGLVGLAALVATAAPADVCKEAYEARNVEAEVQCQNAATAGDRDAQFGYGLVLFSGRGQESNPSASLKWLRLAASQGHFLARVMLGRLLSDSDMLSADLRNPVEGYAWWVVAGERDAVRNLSEKLSATQLANAKLLAADYQAKYGVVK